MKEKDEEILQGLECIRQIWQPYIDLINYFIELEFKPVKL